MHFALISVNCRYSHSSLSLFYLREALQKGVPGCRCRLRQFTVNEPYYDILLQLTELEADVIFFSVYIWNSRIISRLIKDLSVVKPNLSMVLGGPQAPFLAGKGLPEKCTTVRGPVEGLPARFYQNLRKKNLADLYEAMPDPPFFLPYREEDLAVELANRAVYYESSRGCPFSCSYCLSASTIGVRSKDVSEVKEDLDRLLAHNPMTIRFVDRTFNSSAARSLEIWRHLGERKEQTVFHFEIAPDLFTEEMFGFLETIPPGKFRFEIGVQSTNPATLTAINRASDTASSLTTIERLAAMDSIHLHVDLILGLPFDDMATFSTSFNRVFRSAPHYIQMGLLKVLPDTPIREKAGEFELSYCQEPPYQTLSTRWLSHRELSRLYWFGECVEAFYNNRYFNAFFNYIRKRQDGFDFFSDLLDLCLAKNFFRLAKTQEFMTTLLCSLANGREDSGTIREILCYDWLRTGKRFLPQSLVAVDLLESKKKMRRVLPPEYLPLFTGKTRNAFFKKSIFLPLSAQTLGELDLEKGKEGVVCFLPEQEETVQRLQKTVTF